MPEDMNNLQQEVITDGTTTNDQSISSPTADEFKKYEKQIKETDLTAAGAAYNEAKVRYKDAMRSRQFKRCMFKKSKDALREYEALANGIVTTASQDAVEIDKSIKGYLDQSALVKSAFDEAIQAIKAAKLSLWQAEDTANNLAEVVENSDNSEELKWLKKHVHGFETAVKNIQTKADATNDLADDAFEIAVKVAGINAYANVSSLTPLSTSLSDDMGKLKTDINGNITFNKAEKEAAQLLLTDLLTTQSSRRAEKLRAWLKLEGVLEMRSFVHEPGCADGDIRAATRKKIDELAHKVEQNFM